VLCAPGDWRAVAAALVELAGDATRREGMGEAARRHVLPRFGANRLVEDIDNLYRDFLMHRARTATSAEDPVA
jgi:hypothetical protein